MDWQSMLFQFFGGLGIFLFGLKYMGDGLQRSAGDNLRNILNKFTSTPFRAVLAGILVTVLMQSSSGTTVLAVGLVSAGFMNLEQAIDHYGGQHRHDASQPSSSVSMWGRMHFRS